MLDKLNDALNSPTKSALLSKVGVTCTDDIDGVLTLAEGSALVSGDHLIVFAPLKDAKELVYVAADAARLLIVYFDELSVFRVQLYSGAQDKVKPLTYTLKINGAIVKTDITWDERQNIEKCLAGVEMEFITQ